MHLPMVRMTSSMYDQFVLRKPLLAGPLVGRAYRICFPSPHPIAQKGKFQIVGIGPLIVNSYGHLKMKGTLS